MANQLTSIALDWLQLHCRILDEDKQFRGGRGVYEAEKRPYGTKFFHDVWYISENKRLIATVCTNPRQNLPEETAIVKFENDVIYQGGLKQFVETFLSICNLEFIGITRLDVAVDFNRFANGWEGEEFIDKYLRKKIVKMGRGTVKLAGRNERYFLGETLKFGGTDSPIQVYLYNKTREMEKKKYKPWIVAQWDAVGLNLKENVWRLEVSIRGARKQLQMVSTGSPDGETSTSIVNFYSLEIIDQIQALWETLVKKYFDFAKDRPQEKNKSRLKRLHLFDNMVHRAVIIERTDKLPSNHMDRYFINVVNKTAIELQGTADDLAEFAKIYKDWFIYSRDMERQQQLARDKLISEQPLQHWKIEPEPIEEKPISYIQAEFNFDE